MGAYTNAEPYATDDATKALQAIAKTEERLVFLLRAPPHSVLREHQ